MISKKMVKELIYFVGGAFLGVAILLVVIGEMSNRTVLPGIKVAGNDVSMMNQAELTKFLGEMTDKYEPSTDYGGAQIAIPKDIYKYDLTQTVNRALEYGKKFRFDEILALYRGEVNLDLAVKLDQEKLASWSGEVETLVTIPGKVAELKFTSKTSSIVNGEDGVQLDHELLESRLVSASSKLDQAKVVIPVKQEVLSLSSSEQGKVLQEVENLRGKKLEIMIPDNTVSMNDQELVSFIALAPGNAGTIDQHNLSEYTKGLATRYNSEPQDAKFEFENGKVKEFAPARDGISVDVVPTANNLKAGIQKLLETEEKTVKIEAEITRVKPMITTEEVNNLGIVELIGKGESYYAHSIPNRIYNVGLAASRVNSAIVAPGEEFSFNKMVGEITASTGYRTAYVISNGRTELGDGGGVCQVSTTLFRAAMNAGLPITERWAHAYRVGYYEQNSKPGIDATIYSPSKDLKFVNDTPGHILIQAINDPKNVHLIFEIYGTKDGRVATVSEPRVSGITPPPPDLYQDDPTLPAGVVKQVDWSAWGAKASFDYRVEKNGEVTFAKTFTSNYRPWANVFLRGTAGQ